MKKCNKKFRKKMTTSCDCLRTVRTQWTVQVGIMMELSCNWRFMMNVRNFYHLIQLKFFCSFRTLYLGFFIHLANNFYHFFTSLSWWTDLIPSLHLIFHPFNNMCFTYSLFFSFWIFLSSPLSVQHQTQILSIPFQKFFLSDSPFVPFSRVNTIQPHISNCQSIEYTLIISQI